MSKKVLVIAEEKQGKLRHVSFEAVAAAYQIAQGGETVALLIGKHVQPLASSLVQAGADRVLIAEHDQLAHYTPDGFAQAAAAAVEKEQPDVIVMGHTAMGKDLSPKLAVKLGMALLSDATAVEAENGIVVTRPIYSGKAFEKVTAVTNAVIVTIRPNNIEAREMDEARSGTVEPLAVDITDLRTVIQDVVRKAAAGVDLAEAKVIVAGGRGVKSASGFKPLQELADVLGGAVGASRGACDADYCDYALQIGQTGKVVTPDLYIACGISGAIQHLAGMSNSKVIVAINKDPEADIFKVADYGIVGDLFDVVPMLTEECRKIKAGSA